MTTPFATFCGPSSSVRGQEYLRALELARRMLASAQKRREFAALGLAEFDPIAYNICASSKFEAQTNS